MSRQYRLVRGYLLKLNWQSRCLASNERTYGRIFDDHHMCFEMLFITHLKHSNLLLLSDYSDSCSCSVGVSKLTNISSKFEFCCAVFGDRLHPLLLQHLNFTLLLEYSDNCAKYETLWHLENGIID